MRRHLSPVAAAILILVLASRSGLSQEAPPVPANRVPGNVFIARAPFVGDLSVVGSDGIFYRVRHATLYPTDFGVLSLPVGPAVVPPPPSSILEAIDLDPNSKRPVDSIAFAGLASQLGIGKDNRLYLVVNVTPPVSIATGGTTNLVPVPVPQSRLYIIPTPFPPRALGTALESIAVPVNLEVPVDAITEGTQNLDAIVRADFEGHAQSLKVKAVGDLEYLYLSAVIPSYRFPTLTNTGDASPRLGPIKPLVKLLIFNSNGRKIKEVDTE
jgi:hypothetical protein